MSGEKQSGDVTVSIHGPGATIETAIEVAEATKRLLAAVAAEMGHTVEWRIGSIQFKCDGCGLLRPDKPGPDEGWTHKDSNDYCPNCTGDLSGVAPEKGADE